MLSAPHHTDEKNIYQVDMIKIDVEGAEMEVLAGAGQLLKNSSELVLLLDLHPHNKLNKNES